MVNDLEIDDGQIHIIDNSQAYILRQLHYAIDMKADNVQ